MTKVRGMSRHKYGKPPELHRSKSYLVGDKIVHVEQREETLFRVALGDNDKFKSMIKAGDVYYVTDGGGELSIPLSWDHMLDKLGTLDHF